MEAALQEHKEWVDELERKSVNQGSPTTSHRNLVDKEDSFDENSPRNEQEEEENPQVRYEVPEQFDDVAPNHANGKVNKKVVRSREEQSRWEQLYQLNKIQKETKEYFYQALKLNGEEKELKKCTFQPKLNKKSKQISKSSYNGNFFERKNQWKMMKEEKLKQISENKQDKELLHCTFQPQILGSSKTDKKQKELIGNKPAKALNKFIERQKLARKEKLRKNAILNGDRSYNKRHGGNTESYMSKFVKNKEGDDDGVLKKVRNCSFSNAVLCLHRHLNSFDINLD